MSEIITGIEKLGGGTSGSQPLLNYDCFNGHIYVYEFPSFYIINFGPYANMTAAIPSTDWTVYNISWMKDEFYGVAFLTPYDGSTIYPLKFSTKTDGKLYIRPGSTIPQMNGVHGTSVYIPKVQR